MIICTAICFCVARVNALERVSVEHQTQIVLPSGCTFEYEDDSTAKQLACRPIHSMDIRYNWASVCVCVWVIISKQYRDIVFDADNFVTTFPSVCEIRFLSSPKCALWLSIRLNIVSRWRTEYFVCKFGICIVDTQKTEKWHKIALYLFIKSCSSATHFPINTIRLLVYLNE